MGTTLFRKTRGHPSENRILLSFQLHEFIITYGKLMLNQKNLCIGQKIYPYLVSIKYEKGMKIDYCQIG